MDGHLCTDTQQPATERGASRTQVDAAKRLGGGPSGAQAIRDHPYFEGLDWAALEAGVLTAPFQSPAPADPLSASAAATAAADFGDGYGPSEK